MSSYATLPPTPDCHFHIRLVVAALLLAIKDLIDHSSGRCDEMQSMAYVLLIPLNGVAAGYSHD